MKISAIFLIFISFSALAIDNERENQRRIMLKADKVEDISAKDLNNFPEIYLKRDTIIQNRNDKTGIFTDPHYSLSDQSRFALGLGLSQDYQNPTKVQSIYAAYMNRIDDFYQELWWGFHFKRTQAHFNAISDDATTGGRGTNQQSLTIMGTGVGHSFVALADLFDTNKLFEVVSVYFNYNFHLDSTDDQRYQGFGYTADYSLSYRTSKKFFWGTKFSYNWAQVERPEENNESLLARSLVFGWTTISFELGFIF